MIQKQIVLSFMGKSSAVSRSSLVGSKPTSLPTDFFPRWTKRVITSMTGRDPLGLSHVSGLLTDYLLKGITTQSDRARYYSFYCWAIWHTNLSKPIRMGDFETGMRRRESAMAVATVLNNPDTSPVGVEATCAAIDRCSGSEQQDCDFRVLPSNSLGGYGQYYAGSLRNLGLTFVDDQGIDQVSDSGYSLAQAHNRSIADSTYIKAKVAGSTRVDQTIIKNSARLLSLDSLHPRSASEEIKQLIDLFFSPADRSPNEGTLRRRETLGLILHVVLFYQRLKETVPLEELDFRLVHLSHYYDAASIKGKIVPYVCPAQFAVCHGYWRQFCLHQLLANALERLLFATLETIGSMQDGLTLRDIVLSILDSGLLSEFQRFNGFSCNSPAQLLVALKSKIPSFTSQRANQLSYIKSHLEYDAAEAPIQYPAEAVAKALSLLAMLYLRWRTCEDNAFLSLKVNAGSELWAGNVLPFLDIWSNKSLTWEIALHDLLKTFVIDRHDRVMYQKQRLDSCWLHQENGRILKDQDYEPLWRSSRHKSAVTILRDLGLLSVNSDNGIEITSGGKNVFKTIWN